MAKSLLSDADRRKLESKAMMTRQAKSKLLTRLKNSLRPLAEDIHIVFNSPHLDAFNLENERGWFLVLSMLVSCYNALSKSRMVQEYRVLDRVDKDGANCYFISRTVSLSYEELRIEGGKLKPMRITGPAFQTKAELYYVAKYMDNPTKLEEMLSLINIVNNPHARGVLRKALRLYYPFPTNAENAVPLRIIRRWVENEELKAQQEKSTLPY